MVYIQTTTCLCTIDCINVSDAKKTRHLRTYTPALLSVVVGDAAVIIAPRSDIVTYHCRRVKETETTYDLLQHIHIHNYYTYIYCHACSYAKIHNNYGRVKDSFESVIKSSLE